MIFASNKKAKFDYEVLETFEAGIVLSGSEIKSLRVQNANLKGSFVKNYKGELFLQSAHIGTYKPAGKNQHITDRDRKLLLHKKQIIKIEQAAKEAGKTIVPLDIYSKGSLIKVRIAIGKGRKLHDKRSVLKDRDARREAAKELKQSLR